MKTLRLARLPAVLLPLALTFSLLFSNAAAQGSSLIYTSVPQDVIDVLQDAYQRSNPGYTLEVFRGGTAAILARVAAEREAGGIVADLIWVADPSEIVGLQAEGLLLTHTSAETAALPENFRDPNNQYFAGRVLGMVIAYNTLMVNASEAPTSWADLLKPEFANQIGFPTPVNSGAAMVTVAALLSSPDFGLQYIEALGANGARQLQNNGAAAQAVATGELKVAIGLDFQIRALQAEGSPVGYVYPADGGVFIPSPIAIFTGSPNPDNARHFLDYILSAEGQATLVERANFIPARDDVAGPEGIGDISGIPQLTADVNYLIAERENILVAYEANLSR